MTTVHSEFRSSGTGGLIGGGGGSSPQKKKPASVLERRSTFEGKEMSSAAATKPPSLLLGKKQSVKEGLVSKMASKFQQQADDSNSTTTATTAAASSSSSSTMTPSSRKTSSVETISNPTSLRKSSSDVSPSVENNKLKSAVHVTRTESHHARFNTARAMFEKMGSAEELDEKPPPPPPPSSNNRASSVGRPVSRSSDEENNINNVNSSSSNASYKNSSAYFRSRSTSPYAHQSESGTNGTAAAERQSRKTSANGISTSSSYHNGLTASENGGSSTMGLVKSRRLSFQQKQQQSDSPSSNESPLIHKSSSPRTSFPANNFTKTENVDSARRTSVKNDNVPSLISSPAAAAASASGSSNLDMPGDRRPLSARNSNSTDGIEDYLKNWKKSTSPVNEEDEKKYAFIYLFYFVFEHD